LTLIVLVFSIEFHSRSCSLIERQYIDSSEVQLMLFVHPVILLLAETIYVAATVPFVAYEEQFSVEKM